LHQAFNRSMPALRHVYSTWKMSAYPARDSTPSWMRAPPESLSPITGAPTSIAWSIICTQRSHDLRYFDTKVTWPALSAHKGHMTYVICTQRSHDLRYLHTKVTWPTLSAHKVTWPALFAHKGHMTYVICTQRSHDLRYLHTKVTWPVLLFPNIFTIFHKTLVKKLETM